MVGIVPFYCDRWLTGTVELTLEEKGAFIDWVATYASRDGLFPDDINLYAKTWRCNPRTARRLRAALIAKGKLYIDGNLAHQVLAKVVVAKAIAKSAQCTDAAFTRWKNHRENNGAPHANADALATPETHASAHADGYATPREEEKKASSLGESQQNPPVENPPPATSLATALPPGALASSPPIKTPPTKPELLTLAQINKRWRGPFT